MLALLLALAGAPPPSPSFDQLMQRSPAAAADEALARRDTRLWVTLGLGLYAHGTALGRFDAEKLQSTCGYQVIVSDGDLIVADANPIFPSRPPVERMRTWAADYNRRILARSDCLERGGAEASKP